MGVGLLLGFAGATAVTGFLEGMLFEVEPTDPLTLGAVAAFLAAAACATADPQVPEKSGDNYYFIDETGVIRFSSTGTATVADGAIGK